MAAEQPDIMTEEMDLELCCPVQTRVLPLLRSFIATVAHQMGFDDEQCAQIEMAVDEACANVIRHAYKHIGVSPDLTESSSENVVRQCTLRVRLTLGSDWLRITIIDKGIGLVRSSPGVNSLEEFQERGGKGGLGIFIINNFMDEVLVDCPGDAGTVLTMTKYLVSPPQRAVD